MTNLNFSMSELIYSDTAIKNNINNMPDINSLDCMLDLIVYCLQPIRDMLGKPMIITSGYRNAAVNKLTGGADNSQHLKGQAVDFVVSGMTNKDVVNFIRNTGVKFTQLIEEYGSNNVSWVHIGYDKTDLRGEVLKYKNGVYVKI